MDFVTAMTVETLVHEKREHWDVLLRSHMPLEMKTIMAIWAFKRKRLPDGTILKHKARLSAHGGMQQWGVNYWETYAPLVNWTSVRFLLTIAQLSGLHSQAIDFVLVFPQSDLDVPIYMEVPAGMTIEGVENKRMYVLKLN